MKSKSFICLTNIWLTNTSSKSKKQPQGLTFRWYLQHLNSDGFKQNITTRSQIEKLRKHWLKVAKTALTSDFSPVFTKCIGVLLIAFIFTGCGIKPDPVYKEVLTPIRCQAKMPVKPANDGSFEAHKNKMVYYLRCESALKYCLGLTPLKGD